MGMAEGRAGAGTTEDADAAIGADVGAGADADADADAGVASINLARAPGWIGASAGRGTGGGTGAACCTGRAITGPAKIGAGWRAVWKNKALAAMPTNTPLNTTTAKLRRGWRATALIHLEKRPGSRRTALGARRGAVKVKSS